MQDKKSFLLEKIHAYSDPQHPKARGYRLQYLRLVTCYPRKMLAELLDVALNTYRNWEQGSNTGIPQHAVSRLIAVFQTLHVRCSQEWLLTGKGDLPTLDETHEVVVLKLKASDREHHYGLGSESERVELELKRFCELNPHPAYYTIEDESMAPFYHTGDIVAGYQHFGEAIKTLAEKQCIIETRTGEKVCRKLKNGSKKKHYRLACENPSDHLFPYSDSRSEISESELYAVSPVLWHRRRLTRH